MGKTLTQDLVLTKSKCDNLLNVKNLNLWGNEIDDMKLLKNMPNVEVLSLSVNKISTLKDFAHCHKL
jgi:cilla- and flagella-associated protein